MLKKFQKKQEKFINLHVKKARAGNIIAIYKLFNRYYVKSFFGPFFAFVFPVLIYAILGTLQNYKLAFPGIAALTTLTALSGIPIAILELKKSVLMKRIGASPVKTSTFTFVIVSYFALQIFLAILWLMLWALIIYRDPSMFSFLKKPVGFFSFFYGIILNIFISISLAFLISSISKTEQQAQSISMMIMFVSQFLAGMFINIGAISSNDVMNWISRLTPYRYSTMYLVSALKNVNAFDFTKDIPFYANWEIIVAYFYPWIIISVCTLVAIKKFSWSSAR